MSNQGDDSNRSPFNRLKKSKSLASLRERMFPSRDTENPPPVPQLPRAIKASIGQPQFQSTSNRTAAAMVGASASAYDSHGGSLAQSTGTTSGSMPAFSPHSPHRKPSPTPKAATSASHPSSTPHSPHSKPLPTTPKAATSTSHPSSSTAIPDTIKEAAMKSKAAIDKQYPQGDPYAAKRALYSPIQYSEPGQATGLQSHPASRNEIEYEKKAMAVAAQKKRAMEAKKKEEAEEEAYVNSKTTGMETGSTGKGENPNINPLAGEPRDQEEVAKGSPIKRISHAVGSKLKNVFSKKEH